MNEVTIDSGVGIRELKAHLSSYLAKVGRGASIIVTDHGRPVAELVPFGRRDRLAELIAQGRATPPKLTDPYTPEPVPDAGPVSDLVPDQRR